MRKHSVLSVFLAVLLVLFLSAADGYSQICSYPVMFGSSAYTSTAEAYTAAGGLSDFSLMLAIDGLLEEDVFNDQNARVTLEGGWDCYFQTRDINSASPIFGSLTISAGTVVVSNIKIASPLLCIPDPNNYPYNAEICDCLDNNCNNLIDDGLAIDNDGDGYTALGSCGGSADDCNDNDASIHPYGETYGDGIDQDCIAGDITAEEQECIGCHGLKEINGTSRYNKHHVYVAAPDGTCVNCHAEIVNALLPGHYGQTVRTADNNMAAGATIGCKSCHDSVPPRHYLGANVVWQKVLDYVAAYDNLTCDACHENRAAEHATVWAHDNRLIDNSCGYCHTSDTTVLGQPGSGTLTSQGDVDTLHGSDCSICHAYSGTRVCVQSVEATIQAGLNGIAVSCLDCHTGHHSGTRDRVSYDPAVDTSWPSQYGCTTCHHDYDNVNGTSLGLSTWDTILVEHDLDGTKDGSLNTCANCHEYDGSGSPLLANVQNAIASGNFATCATCHTDKVPDVEHGVPISGKHSEHLNMAGVICDTCHMAGDYPYFNSGTDANGDGRYDLTETDACDICHQDGSGNPVSGYKDGWSDPGFVLACDSCHAAPPATGTHLTHYGGTDATLDYGDLRVTEDFAGGGVSSINMIGCGNCHPIDSPFHGNGTWGDVELSNINATAGSLKAFSINGSYDPATKTCSNVYCHSANSWTTENPYEVPMPWPESTGWDVNIDPLPRPLPDNITTSRVYKDVTWDSGEMLTCNGCHDNPPRTSSADNDGGAGDSHYWVDGYGYENLHVWNMSYNPVDCRTCHYDTVRAASTWGVDFATGRRYYDDAALYNKAKHVNGSVDVVFDSVNNFTNRTQSGPVIYDLSVASFNPTTKTCSNVECHKDETAVTWGLPYRWENLTECHRCHE